MGCDRQQNDQDEVCDVIGNTNEQDEVCYVIGNTNDQDEAWDA